MARRSASSGARGRLGRCSVIRTVPGPPRTSRRSAKACSISGCTVSQFSLLLPQPRTGRARERRPSSLTISIRAGRPARMSSRQEGCRQCRLVGKLMTGLGVARLTGRHHQHLPWLDLADPACCPVVGIDLEIRRFDAQRHPHAHGADAVHGVDDRLGVGVQHVSLSWFDHSRVSNIFANGAARGDCDHAGALPPEDGSRMMAAGCGPVHVAHLGEVPCRDRGAER